MIRLFVAIPIPEAIRLHLSMICSGAPGAKWVAPENYHLSLRFIGEVDHGVADDIDSALSEIQAPSFPLKISGVGYFGKGDKARILWAGAAPQIHLDHLQAKVESALVRAGLPAEGRRFFPHVTLARLKRPDPARLDAYVGDHAGFQAMPFSVDRFVLYSSFLSQSGAIYTPEADYSLSHV
jgi:RNA 2',3'-cyclic 3'-phosphodiesterase